MNKTPSDLKFLDSHEWIKVDDDSTVIVGISDHAQSELGEVVFVELPGIGDEFVQGDEAAVVESVKAASELYTPLSGEVVEVNEALEENPELINTSPYEEGWFFKMKVGDENLGSIDSLMTAEEYLSMLDGNS
jgi:glycine cleavage system H protein